MNMYVRTYFIPDFGSVWTYTPVAKKEGEYFKALYKFINQLEKDNYEPVPIAIFAGNLRCEWHLFDERSRKSQQFPAI